MREMVGELRAQRDDMKTFMDGVLDVLKNMTVTREIIRETVQYSTPKDDFEPVVSVVNDLPAHLPQPAALPSKLELARKWLRDHPDDMQQSGRELEASCKPMGVEISYVTWNKVKKEMTK